MTRSGRLGEVPWRLRSRTRVSRRTDVGLDPIGAAEFDELIGTLQRTLGLTVFMVTHDLDSLIRSATETAAWPRQWSWRDLFPPCLIRGIPGFMHIFTGKGAPC